MIPLTHDERIALIHRPFFITTFGTSYPHGGCIVGDSFPQGREGEALLHEGEVGAPVTCDYILDDHGRRFLVGEGIIITSVKSLHPGLDFVYQRR
jgi:hypothetical protein